MKIFESVCCSKNSEIGNQLSLYCCFNNKYVNNYFVFDRLGVIKTTCERLSDTIYNAIIPIRDEGYLKSELHF